MAHRDRARAAQVPPRPHQGNPNPNLNPKPTPTPTPTPNPNPNPNPDKDGYGFPLNPIWPVRDAGWFEVLQALKSNPESSANMNAWFPPDSRVMEKIESLHREHPGCFK